MEKEKIKDIIERLRGFSTPELCDGAGLYHSMDHRLRQEAAIQEMVRTGKVQTKIKNG